MKNRNTDFLRKAFFAGIIAVVVLVLVLYNLRGTARRKKASGMVVLEEAPDTLLSERSSIWNYSAGGSTYRIGEDGTLEIVTPDGTYRVMGDGSVWKKNPDGTWSRVEDPTEIARVLTEARKIAEEDGMVAAVIDSQAVDGKIDLSSLSQSQLEEIAKMLGVDVKDLKKFS